MQKLNLIGKIFLSFVFTLPFSMEFVFGWLYEKYIYMVVVFLSILFSLYLCIWFDNRKKSRFKRLVLNILRLVIGLAWLWHLYYFLAVIIAYMNRK